MKKPASGGGFLVEVNYLRVSTGGEVLPVVGNEMIVPATILRAAPPQTLQVPFLVHQDFHLVSPQFVTVEIVPSLGEIGVSLLPFFH